MRGRPSTFPRRRCALRAGSGRVAGCLSLLLYFARPDDGESPVLHRSGMPMVLECRAGGTEADGGVRRERLLDLRDGRTRPRLYEYAGCARDPARALAGRGRGRWDADRPPALARRPPRLVRTPPPGL